MPLDYFDDSEDTQSESSGEGKDAQDATDSGGKTALVDSSLCPGMKPGDEFTVRVDKVLDSGEYQISYPGGKDDESSEPSPDNEMSEGEGSQPSEMSAYMS